MPSPAPPTSLTSDLRRLGLPRTADDLNDVIARAIRQRWSPTALLEHVVTAELEERRRRSVERRLTAARLGRFKPIADWDWDVADRARPPRARTGPRPRLPRPRRERAPGRRPGPRQDDARQAHRPSGRLGRPQRALYHRLGPCCSISMARRLPAPSNAASATTRAPPCSPSMRLGTSPTMPTPPTSSSRSSAGATNTVPCS